MEILQRKVLAVEHPEPRQGMTSQHRVRPLMPAAMRGEWEAVDPFLALMEDWFPRGVFGKHPHRGIETVTYVLEGRVDHYDNLGHEGAIRPGEAQWMTAGRGLIHNEIPAEGDTVHSLQLWVNLPASDKMTAPRYQDLVGENVPVRRAPGAEIRVFSESVPEDHVAFFVVYEGEATAPTEGGECALKGLTLATLGPGERAELKANEAGARALLLAARPLNEPVAWSGPFVMNTREELMQAFEDYRQGRF